MGNTKSQTRGLSVARGGAPVEEDPFAELADIFESELRFDPRFSESTAPQTLAMAVADRREPGFASEAMDREFEAAFENDLAAGKKARVATTAPSYETRVNGRVTAQTASRSEASARRPSQSRPTHLTDEEIDDELDAVLRNLSAPARPRGRIVVETQSFAPERPAEERLPAAPHSDMDEFEELIRSELAVIRPAVATSARRQERPVETAQHYAAEDFEPEDDYPVVARRSSLKKALVTGVSAAALVLFAGVGFGIWQSGSTASDVGDAPLLIKADSEPFKIVPKDPGGRAYPNQNKAVYDRVAAPGKAVDETPMQRALLKTAEEPMDLPKEEEGRSYDDLPGVEIGDSVEDEGKNETRVTEATETSAEPVLQPRKVRTLPVGADGKLVQPDTAAAAKPIAAVPAAPLRAAEAPLAAEPTEIATLAPVRPAVPSARAPAPQPPVAAEPPPVEAQPVEVASAVPTSGFFVQVSSQPSEAAAQQSMRSFGSRYGSVVGGRPVGIKSAEVAGKGTYWRVRVAASSKEEAASLCSKLKSAGANCFVTR